MDLNRWISSKVYRSWVDQLFDMLSTWFYYATWKIGLFTLGSNPKILSPFTKTGLFILRWSLRSTACLQITDHLSDEIGLVKQTAKQESFSDVLSQTFTVFNFWSDTTDCKIENSLGTLWGGLSLTDCAGSTVLELTLVILILLLVVFSSHCNWSS